MQVSVLQFIVFSTCFLNVCPANLSFTDSYRNHQAFRQHYEGNTGYGNEFQATHYQKHFHHQPQLMFVPPGKKRVSGGALMSNQWKPLRVKKKKTGGKAVQFLRRKPSNQDMDKECNGMENLVMDIGITSYLIGLSGFIIGIVDLGWSFAGQWFSVWSTIGSYIAAIPSFFITLFAKSSPFWYVFGNILSFISLGSAVLGHMGLPVGDISLLIGVLGEVLGLVSLIIGAFATFPKALQYIIDFLVAEKGSEVQTFIDNYNCPR